MLPLVGRGERMAPAGIVLPELHVRTLGAALLFLGLFSISLVQFTDPDYWWHLRTGQLIAETRAIPDSDPFSFTKAGAPWVAHEWLSEVIIYSLDRAVGYAGSALIFSGLALAALFLMHRLALRLGLGELPALGLAALAGVMSVPYWTVRPQVFTWLLTAVFLTTLWSYYRRGGGRLWHLPPLMLLWANLHLGFVFGLAVLGLWLLALAVERWRGERAWDLRQPLLVAGASLLASLVNPSGPLLLIYPVTNYLQSSASGFSMISEWRSPDFHQPLHLPLAAGILLLALVGATAGRRNLFAAGLALLFTFLALQSGRNQPLFAMVLVPVLAEALSGRWAWARRQDEESRGPGGPAALNWGMLIASVLLAVALVPRAPGAQVGREPLTSGSPTYPVEGAAFVRDHYPGARMFNEYTWGGYLIHELYPDTRVFIDGRSDMYGDGLLTEYRQVVSLEPEWSEVLEKRGVDLLLVEKTAALATVLRDRSDWTLAFSGPVEAVFVRAGEEASERP